MKATSWRARSHSAGWRERASSAAGVIYGIIGILALKLALGDGGEATDQQGALKTIAQQSFGEALLILVAVALAGYALWRLVRAAVGHGAEQRDDGTDRLAAARQWDRLRDPLRDGSRDPDRLRFELGKHRSRRPAASSDWTGGPVLVAIAGAVLIGVAAYQAYKGLAKKFLEDAKTHEMGSTVRKGYTWVGVFGLVARAVIFALVGYGLIKAAIDYDPDEAVGLDGALLTLTQAKYGPVLLGIVAAGLAGFAIYSFADARYRKV